MRRKYAVVPIAAALLAGTLAFANESHAVRAAEQGTPVLLAQANPGKAAGGDAKQMYDHMDMMQKKMNKYHASKDQKERFRLRGELYADMRDHMKLMRGGGVGGNQKSRETMEKRMEQMHQMMEWMFTFDTDFKPLGP